MYLPSATESNWKGEHFRYKRSSDENPVFLLLEFGRLQKWNQSDWAAREKETFSDGVIMKSCSLKEKTNIILSCCTPTFIWFLSIEYRTIVIGINFMPCYVCLFISVCFHLVVLFSVVFFDSVEKVKTKNRDTYYIIMYYKKRCLWVLLSVSSLFSSS